MTELAFMALTAGLKLWGTKEAKEYLDRVIDLKKDWYEEYNKDSSDDPDEKTDHAVLDNIAAELRIIGEALNSKAAAAYTANQ